PRCCKTIIRAKDARLFLGGSFSKKTQAARRQLTGRNPISCHDCETYLAPDLAVGSTRRVEVECCPACLNETCVWCRRARHQGSGPCLDGSDAFAELAKRNGWKRCLVCSVMIERVGGCQNIHCLCGHRMCYLCGTANCSGRC
ncbi:hypothetical protein BO70DRAFT_255999, partial [Aspergillus heteromorphus CBS 117.55]